MHGARPVDEESNAPAATSAQRAHRLRLMWVRRVVDDFPAAFQFYRSIMSPVASPAVGEAEPWEERGYVRLWNCTPGTELELELVAREHFDAAVGGGRLAADTTFVFDADDVDAAVAHLAASGATVVVAARDETWSGGGNRFAQLRDPLGTLIEVSRSWIDSFGGMLDGGAG